MDEAIEWLKRSPFGGGAEVDIRPIYEIEDLDPVSTPEIRERDRRLRAQLAGKK
jgi:hypothetical protein